MNRLFRSLAPAPAMLLLVLVAPGCGQSGSSMPPETAPETPREPPPETPPGPPPEPAPEPAPVLTSRYTLGAAIQASGSSLAPPSPTSRTFLSSDPAGALQPPTSGAFVAVLTADSASSGEGALEYKYDAYVVTARESGAVKIRSDVIEVNPGTYPYGYGFPLSMGEIAPSLGGDWLQAYGGNYEQNAIETGTAIVSYCVEAGRQYVLVYKAFRRSVPLTYQLTVPATLAVEGRIDTLPTPVPVPSTSAGMITLENPRPDVLNRLVPALEGQVSYSPPLLPTCPATVPLGLTAAAPAGR